MKNRTILITGGTTGIGLAMAQLLSREGARVIVTGRRPENIASARQALPADAVVLASDSGSLDAARSLGAEVRQHAERLDGVVLNAGVAAFAPFEAATPENYEQQFNINVRGPYFQLQSLLPLLGKGSSVVLTASVVAGMAFPNTSIYSATKAAVVSLGKTLAVELSARGIRVYVLSPGPVETPIFEKGGFSPEATRAFLDERAASLLVKRVGTPDDIAHLARFLLSPEAGNITGAEFISDGGARFAPATAR
jgi:NAD(P)-dependent dehydrogenase (short-subunit alcohol dehydrogenase family)